MGEMNKSFLDNKKTACLRDSNGNFGFWYHLGNDYLRINEAVEAIECYEIALKFDPLIFDTYSHIGEAYLQLDKLFKALIYFKKSVDIQPQYGEGWYNLGNACRLSSDMAQCLVCYEKAIQCFILPSDAAFYDMGHTFLQANALENALKSLNLGKSCVLAKTNNTYKALICLNIGHIHFLKGDIECTKEEYYKSIRSLGSYTLFRKKAEADLPGLVNLDFDSVKWHILIDKIKNDKIIYLKIAINRIIKYIFNIFNKKIPRHEPIAEI